MVSVDRMGLVSGARVELTTVAEDGIPRRKAGLTLLAYDVPKGCLAAYYPECNVLVPLSHHERDSLTPAAKSVPVRIAAEVGDARVRGGRPQIEAM